MENEKTILPVAQPVSSGSSGVSAPFSIMPEEFAGQTGALSQSIFALIAAPASDHREAAAVFNCKFEDMAQSLHRLSQEANSSWQGMNATIAEALRKSIEHSMMFMEDFAAAKAPADALSLQLSYISRQLELFSENSKLLQREFAKFFRPRAGRVPTATPRKAAPR
jgi:hypothetical protein